MTDPVGEALNSAFAALDDLIVLAANPETRPLLCAEKIALGHLLKRCTTLAAFAFEDAKWNLHLARPVTTSTQTRVSIPIRNGNVSDFPS